MSLEINDPWNNPIFQNGLIYSGSVELWKCVIFLLKYSKVWALEKKTAKEEK